MKKTTQKPYKNSNSKLAPKKTSKKPVPKKSTPKKSSLTNWQILCIILIGLIAGAGLFFAERFFDFPHPQVILKKVEQNLNDIKNIFSSVKKSNQPINYAEYQRISNPILWINKTRIRQFIAKNPTSPVSIGLRNRWLLYLANSQRWNDFIADYQPTNQEAVECNYRIALIQIGNKELALSGVKRLWDAHYQIIGPCKVLFNIWRTTSNFDENLLWERYQFALNPNLTQININELQAVVQWLPVSDRKWAVVWDNLHQHPEMLPQTALPSGPLGQRILVNVLMQWARKDVHAAISYWNKISKASWRQEQIQHFYLLVSLHLALQGEPSAEDWFAKILPEYSTEESRAWQVRFTLIHQAWQKTLNAIAQMPTFEQQQNIWQYWKARAFESLGQTGAAQVIYQKLAQDRQYYGFLASTKLHQSLSIQQENYSKDTSLLNPFQKQIQQIKQLYNTYQYDALFPLTRDLLNQLNPIGQYTLAYVFRSWGWDAEAMLIVNRSPFQGDLLLRFPTPHQDIIIPLANQNNLSPAFVYALARQESNFKIQALSGAGGIGLLQLTLDTAKQFDATLTQKLLYVPKTNISISIQYLNKLMHQFDNYPLLVTSSYNAGPRQTRRWQPISGQIPADIWIETRPFGETRNYLKNTVAYYAVYQYLLGVTPDISDFLKPIGPM